MASNLTKWYGGPINRYVDTDSPQGSPFDINGGRLRRNGRQGLRGHRLRSPAGHASADRQQQLSQDIQLFTQPLSGPHWASHRCFDRLGAFQIQGEHVSLEGGKGYKSTDLSELGIKQPVREEVWTILRVTSTSRNKSYNGRTIHLWVRQYRLH